MHARTHICEVALPRSAIIIFMCMLACFSTIRDIPLQTVLHTFCNIYEINHQTSNSQEAEAEQSTDRLFICKKCNWNTLAHWYEQCGVEQMLRRLFNHILILFNYEHSLNNKFNNNIIVDRTMLFSWYKYEIVRVTTILNGNNYMRWIYFHISRINYAVYAVWLPFGWLDSFQVRRFQRVSVFCAGERKLIPTHDNMCTEQLTVSSQTDLLYTLTRCYGTDTMQSWAVDVSVRGKSKFLGIWRLETICLSATQLGFINIYGKIERNTV